MDNSGVLARDFERESHRIDQLIWDSMALHAGETVLFCGFGNDAAWIKRAVEVGVVASVIESREDAIRQYGDFGVSVLRGSTTLIPARDASFDATVAFHYLHEVDPFFHANVVSELARVGKRLIIVEPAPPTDPLGLRIASLYSRAKRELGAFEYYQNVDYWRKLLAIVKADVTVATHAFTRTPPRDAITDTVALILDTMAAEEIPEAYLQELRALAKRPDAQLVPQARFVLVGAAAGAVPASDAGTRYRVVELEPEQPMRATPAPAQSTIYRTDAAPEMPPVIPPSAPAASRPAPFVPPPAVATVNVAAPPPAATSDFPAFGLPSPGASAPQPPPSAPAPPDQSDTRAPFAMPFAVPNDAAPEMPFGIPPRTGIDDPLPKSGFGWEWEPPELAEFPEKPTPPGTT